MKKLFLSVALAAAAFAQSGPGTVRPGQILLSLTTCGNGYSEVTALNGFTVIGTLAANMDVGTTGGANSVTPTTSSFSLTAAAQTVNSLTAAAQTFTGTSFSSVINHTHSLVSTSFTPQLQGGTTASTTGTHIMTSAATGGSLRNAGEVTVAATPATGNPSGGVSSITPAGTNGTSAVTGTMNSSSVTGTITMNSVDNRSAFVKVIFCSKD